MTAKLTDLQLVLLSAATARADGSLLPPPDSIGGQAARIKKAIPPLLKRSLVVEMEVATAEQAWRKQDERHIGVVITEAGRAAIGVEAGDAPPAPVAVPPEPVAPDVTAAPARPTKSARVLALLQRENGATMTELVDATGWLPHTTRAALTGLRKKGHAIARDKRDDVTSYRIIEAA